MLYHIINRRALKNLLDYRLKTTTTNRGYGTTIPTLLSTQEPQETQQHYTTAQKYNNRRAAYKRVVGKLRKKFAVEVAEQRLRDLKEKEHVKAEETRKRLERQRVKNIQSVKNALRQEEKRQKRAIEFQEELKVKQVEREFRRERFEKARRLVLQELEEEAVHWISTPEEVEDAFNSVENQQLLWAMPGGYIGAPDPSEDSEFWRYESHTWDMSKTYPTPRELLLEELVEQVYDESNIDQKFWVDDKLLGHKELKEKSKLRALVREEGRKALLLKQRQMMQDSYVEQNDAARDDGVPAIPNMKPTPSLRILSNYRAMEKEGVNILENDPSKFFVFDSTSTSDVKKNKDGNEGNKNHGLGKPIRLRDPVRDDSLTNTPFPQIIGRLPKPDTRTEREKKRDEREEKMWAAAQADVASGVEFAADDEKIYTGRDPVNYDEVGNRGDEVDLEWEEGLDPEKDADLLATPTDRRYTEEDIDWVKNELEKKISTFEEILKLEEGTTTKGNSLRPKNEAKSDADDFDEDKVTEALGGAVKSNRVDDRGRKYTSYKTIETEVSDDYKDFVDMNRINSVLSDLDEEQIAALKSIDSESEGKSGEQIKAALSKVPGLSKDQVASLVELELSLSSNSELMEKLKR